jgi:(methylthio)acryloyl-CoA hydratase
VGLTQYLVEDCEAKAFEIARRAAQNPALSNFAICSAISHVQNMSAFDASYLEAVVAGMVNTSPESSERLAAFANKTAPLVKPV